MKGRLAVFDASTYSGRRDRLISLLAASGAAEGLALFLGAEPSPMNYADNCHRFRQDSSFLYFFGLQLPGLAASIDLATGKATLYADAPGPDEVVWTGPRPGPAELAAQAGIESVRPRPTLAADARAAKALLWLPPYRAEGRDELAALAGIGAAEVAGRSSLPLVRAALALREIKSPAEIRQMEEAAAASVAMHRAAISGAQAGMREYEVTSLIAGAAYSAGCQLAFPIIATTRGETLHNLEDRNELKAGGLFLVDAGAETAEGYAGDLSSTFPIGRRFEGRQRDIYELSLAAQRAAAACVRPGVPFRDAHLAACRTIFDGLKALGVARGDTEEAIAAGAHALFFPCGTGHQIGLDVHDMESYGEVWVGYEGQPKSSQFGLKSLRMAKPLKSGMVVTVEPGIYFIPALVERWKADPRLASFVDFAALEPFMAVRGIRNEEDWLVTETGGRALGPAFDKSLAAIEKLRADA
ncbi:MAG TPA: Xaa-Pro aminopeptidase [Spirochaetales bacterium]|nr:Xaa-Pro aminopeptidase [Spirochaetales bacterium]HRY56015.1 Xaa-Pro aminopeptidase [Spirochaetia bacterium]